MLFMVPEVSLRSCFPIPWLLLSRETQAQSEIIMSLYGAHQLHAQPTHARTHARTHTRTHTHTHQHTHTVFHSLSNSWPTGFAFKLCVFGALQSPGVELIVFTHQHV